MWIAVSTQPNREPLAIDNLKRQGYETYCPVVRKKVRHARKTLIKDKPLFPGYVFVAFDETRQGVRSIHSTYGVRSLVSFGDKPAQLPSAFVEELKAQEIEGAIPAAPLQETLPAGTPVLIKSGMFKDLIATVTACRPQERVIVMLNFLQRVVKAEISAEHLERA